MTDIVNGPLTTGSSGQETYVIQKNAQEEVRVGLSAYKGHYLLDLRIYAEFGAGQERKPTKKGVTLRGEKIDELITVLARVRAEAASLGLLKGGDA